MKQKLFLGAVLLFYLWFSLVACNKSEQPMVIDPDPDPVDTMAVDTTIVDTTTVDTTTYEDAPIWLPGSQEHGFAKGKKNGKEFEASVFAHYLSPPFDHYIALQMSTYTKEGYLREVIALSEILESSARKYEMNAGFLDDTIVSARYSTLIDGGDVVGDFYLFDTLATTNYFEITAINLEKRMIEGVFSASFIFDDTEPKRDLKNPNYAVFEEINFKCKIID